MRKAWFFFGVRKLALFAKKNRSEAEPGAA